MVRLFVRHTVADYVTWRRGYDAFDSQRKPLGVTAGGVFQAVDNPNDVTVFHDFATVEKAKAFVSSAALKDAMRAAGVQGAPTVWIAKPV